MDSDSQTPVNFLNKIKQNTPLISIIIPLYNNAEYIGETVESVINQTYKNWECIIVDDCSNDNSLNVSFDLVNKYRKSGHKISLIAEHTNKGVSAARNIGVLNSKGNYFVMLDSDDKILPTFLQKTMKLIQQTKVDIVYTDVQEFGDNNRMVPSAEFDPIILLIFNEITGCCLVNKRIWDAGCSWDESMQSSSDYFFWLEAIIDKNFTGKRLPIPLFHYRKVKDRGLYLETIKKDIIIQANIINKYNEYYPPEQRTWSELVLKGSEAALKINKTIGVIPLFDETPEELYNKIKQNYIKIKQRTLNASLD